MGKRSKDSVKAGRGALVRRLRREYGLDEEEARYAAATKDPDLSAARAKDFNRSKANKLRGLSHEAYMELRGDNCPEIWSGWCLPEPLKRPTFMYTRYIPERRRSPIERRIAYASLMTAIRDLEREKGFPGL